MDAWTAVSLVCEVISLIAIPAGIVFIIVSAAFSSAAKWWIETDAIVMRADGQPVAGWFDDLGQMHEAPLGPDAPAEGDDVRIWVARADASRHRLTAPGLHVRGMRTLGLSLLIPGLLAAVVGFAASAV